MAAHHLFADRRCHLGEIEPTLLLADRRVQHDLQEHVAQLFDEMDVGRRVVGVKLADRLHQLVGLLDRVARQRGMGLLAVPRALVAQAPHDLVEAHELGADRRLQSGHVEARQVVGLEAAIEVGPGDLEDGLVRKAEALQHRHGLRGPVRDGELHVRQHASVVGVSDEQRAGATGGGRGEGVGVDEGQLGLDRVDPEA